MSHEGHVVSISLNAFCNFIGSANIPAGGTKTWRKLPFPLLRFPPRTGKIRLACEASKRYENENDLVRIHRKTELRGSRDIAQCAMRSIQYRSGAVHVHVLNEDG